MRILLLDGDGLFFVKEEPLFFVLARVRNQTNILAKLLFVMRDIRTKTARVRPQMGAKGFILTLVAGITLVIVSFASAVGTGAALA